MRTKSTRTVRCLFLVAQRQGKLAHFEDTSWQTSFSDRLTKKPVSSTHVEHRSTRTTKGESHREKDSHREPREEKSSTHTHAAVSNGSSSDRAFKDKHHPLLIAIWNTDRTQTNVDEKLKGLRELLKKGTSRRRPTLRTRRTSPLQIPVSAARSFTNKRAHRSLKYHR